MDDMANRFIMGFVIVGFLIMFVLIANYIIRDMIINNRHKHCEEIRIQKKAKEMCHEDK